VIAGDAQAGSVEIWSLSGTFDVSSTSEYAGRIVARGLHLGDSYS